MGVTIVKRAKMKLVKIYVLNNSIAPQNNNLRFFEFLTEKLRIIKF